MSSLTKSRPFSFVSWVWLIALLRKFNCLSSIFAVVGAISWTVAQVSCPRFTVIYCARPLWLQKHSSVIGILSSIVLLYCILLTAPSFISTKSTPFGIVWVFPVPALCLDWKALDTFSSLANKSWLANIIVTSTCSNTIAEKVRCFSWNKRQASALDYTMSIVLTWFSVYVRYQWRPDSGIP